MTKRKINKYVSAWRREHRQISDGIRALKGIMRPCHDPMTDEEIEIRRQMQIASVEDRPTGELRNKARALRAARIKPLRDDVSSLQSVRVSLSIMSRNMQANRKDQRDISALLNIVKKIDSDGGLQIITGEKADAIISALLGANISGGSIRVGTNRDEVFGETFENNNDFASLFTQRLREEGLTADTNNNTKGNN